MTETKLQEGRVDAGGGSASGPSFLVHLKRSGIHAGEDGQASNFMGSELCLQHVHDSARMNSPVMRTFQFASGAYFIALAIALCAVR